MQHAFLIRIPKRKDRIRAIEVLFEVREPRHAFPGYKWLVMRPHLDALKKAGIPFEDLTDLPEEEDGRKKQPRKAKRQSSS